MLARYTIDKTDGNSAMFYLTQQIGWKHCITLFDLLLVLITLPENLYKGNLRSTQARNQTYILARTEKSLSLYPVASQVPNHSQSTYNAKCFFGVCFSNDWKPEIRSQKRNTSLKFGVPLSQHLENSLSID